MLGYASQRTGAAYQMASLASKQTFRVSTTTTTATKRLPAKGAQLSCFRQRY